MILAPTRIERLGEQGIAIEWPDGVRHSISSRTLRLNCPAADSRAERGDVSHDKPLTAPKSSLLRVVEHTVDQQLSLQSIWLVGNYALGMSWADGHKTGIYTYKLLRELGVKEASDQSFGPPVPQ
jgi:ATP-binding protein involved in chromosome partitioning